eukprot:gene5957-4266_t
MTLEARIVALEKRLVAMEKEVLRLAGARRKADVVPVPPQLEPCSQDTPRVAEVREWCKQNKMYSAVLQWVPSDYYSQSLQWRRDILHADSINHLCKSILLVNTHCSRTDCEDPKNSLYYMILFRYVERFDTEMIMRIVKDWNPGVGKKKFNFRLAPADVSERITGFMHGGVVPFCTPTRVPVIMSSTILELAPSYMWIGAGHIDCKLRVDVQEFINIVKPEVGSFTVPLTEEELERITD